MTTNPFDDGHRWSTVDATSGSDPLQIANRARDRSDWHTARAEYERHLATHPEDWPIHVQLGHALKESGRYDEAEARYFAASRMSPNDADILLHLGHLYKLQGRQAEAIENYRSAARLDARLLDAQRELLALDDTQWLREQTESKAPSGATIYIDISDILHYFRMHSTVNGVQRVQVELFSQVEKRDDFVFTATDARGETFALRKADVGRIAESLSVSGRNVGMSELRSRVDAVFANATEVRPKARDTFAVLGAFWDVPYDVSRTLLRYRNAGCKIVLYIYDLIPIRYPEFLDATGRARFISLFFQVARLADRILTISDHTNADVVALLDSFGIENDVHTVALASEYRPLTLESSDSFIRAAGISGPFVLCVGTVEIRKNHLLLFRVWRHLQKQLGDQLPTLVIVGRLGWRVTDLMDQLSSSRFADGTIRHLTDVTDAQLSELYRRCLFTVFASFAEGWGLPVGESLANGKLCVASDATSIPEVGGDLVDYFDPFNGIQAVEAIRRAIDDDQHRTARETEIRTRFRARSWGDVAADLVRNLSELGEVRKHPSGHLPTLDPGREYRFAMLDTDDDLEIMARCVSLCAVDGWHPADAFGVRAAEPTAPIRFRVHTPGQRIVVCVRLQEMADFEGTPVQLAAHPAPATARPEQPLDRRTLAAEVTADADGLVTVFLQTYPTDWADGRRDVRSAIQTLSYLPSDAVMDRLAALERSVFGLTIQAPGAPG